MGRLGSIGLFALCSLGCQLDLDASSSLPGSAEEQVGNIIVFGEYSGQLLFGASETSEGSIALFAEDCGENIFGEWIPPGSDTVVNLEGELLGSSLSLAGETEDFSLSLTGQFITYEGVSGAWFSDDGRGGAWDANYVVGSQADYFCEAADSLLSN